MFDTTAPLNEAQFSTICLWLLTVTNGQRTGDTELDAAKTREIVVDTFGHDFSLDVLRSLDGMMLLGEFRAKGIKLPAILGPVFAAFARTWTPEIPHCTGCKLPAISVLANRSGVEIQPNGTTCRFCRKGNVEAKTFNNTTISWVTDEVVSTSQEYDDTTVAGTTWPLQERELRDPSHIAPELLEVLDGKKLEVHDWLRFLMVQGYTAFGLTKTPMQVYNSLNDPQMTRRYGRLLAAQLILAVSWRDGGQDKPAAAAQPVPQVRSSSDGFVTHDGIHTLSSAIIDAGLAQSHAALLLGIPNEVTASFEIGSNPGATVRIQLFALSNLVLADGSIPLLRWLRNAEQLLGQRREAALCRVLREGIEKDTLPSRLLGRIEKFLPAQFDILVFKCNEKQLHGVLPGRETGLGTRATALINFMEQRGRLKDLEAFLNQL